MTSNIFTKLGQPSRGSRSFYEQLRSEEEDEDLEAHMGLDEENLRANFEDFDADGLSVAESRMTTESVAFDPKANRRPGSRAAPTTRRLGGPESRWPIHDEEIDNDVPASLLVEPNEATQPHSVPPEPVARQSQPRQPATAGPSSARSQAQWEAATTQQRLHDDDVPARLLGPQPRAVTGGYISGGAREKALWRWVNITNLDSFMRDVYDYFEGGGLWCILCSNALWLM